MSGNEHIQDILKNLPTKPGVYLMKTAEGNIIYVGKARILRNRVRSYFGNPVELSPKTRAMVEHIADIEYIVTDTENEALILETNLIKNNRPKYNVLMRDDKSYPYIKVALEEDFPRVYRTRSFHKGKGRYFGPYTSPAAVDSTLDLLNKLFTYRTCSYDASQWAPPAKGEVSPNWKPKLLKRPCTQYYIHRCMAPCVASISREEYDKDIKQVILFLEGKHEEILKQLQEQMDEAAENLKFEQAAVLRDRIEAVEKVLEKQKIINTSGPGDQDLIATASLDDETCVYVFLVRSGKVLGREHFVLQGTKDISPGEVLTSFIKMFYTSAPHVPAELLLSAEPDDQEVLLGWLKQKRGHSVTFTIPRRGEKKHMLDLVVQNAQEMLEQLRVKWLSDAQKTSLALLELQESLNLVVSPRRIECYDISNIQGTSSVASMIVFENGKPKNGDYRRFKIKTVEGADDFASMQEVLRRRFKRALSSDTQGSADEKEYHDSGEPLAAIPSDGEVEKGWAVLPDLVIIDGGKGQLSAAMAVLEELRITVPTVGLAKENEELFTPYSPDPIILPRASQGLYLVQRVRDEAHRFAITYHRTVRKRQSFASILDEIPGIGPKRKKALLRHFGSVRAIAAAPVEDLAKIDGMGLKAAEKVKEYVGVRD